MGAFGSLSLATKFSIFLVCAIAATFLAGFIKLFINRRRLKKNAKLESLEAAKQGKDQEKLVQGRKLDEGDLFGVRALEHGYFGGVSQSRPSTPSTSSLSSFKLSPNVTVTEWSKAGRLGKHSASSSIIDFNTSKNISVTSLPLRAGSTKHRPSPLRLQSSHTDNMDSIDADENSEAYFPSLAFPHPQTSNPPRHEPESSSSPIGVHFPRPATPTTSTSRPTSYLPRLNFPASEGPGKGGLMVTAPTGMTSSAILDTEVSTAATNNELKGDFHPGFTFHTLPTPPEPTLALTPRPVRRSNIPVPLTSLSPKPPVPRATHFPLDNRTWSHPSSSVAKDSPVGKKRISVYQPKAEGKGKATTVERTTSTAASSVYSIRTSILDERQASVKPQQQQRARVLSTGSEKTHRSSRSTSRTKDSLRKHQKTVSWEKDRENPFSDGTMDMNSDHESTESVKGSSLGWWEKLPSVPPPLPSPRKTKGAAKGKGPAVEREDPGMLSVNAAAEADGRRRRSASDTSQVSVSDFYDAYYRQSSQEERGAATDRRGAGPAGDFPAGMEGRF